MVKIFRVYTNDQISRINLLAARLLLFFFDHNYFMQRTFLIQQSRFLVQN